jgi:cell wall-associated NlpC family hydrolase
MSFSDAIGQVDQIVQWEQQLANPAALNQSTSTSGTSTTASTSSSDSSSSSSFTDALAQAQAQEGTSALSVLDPSDSTDASTSTDGSTSSSDLLSGGDSQLLSALQAASSGSSSADADTSASSTASSSELNALEAALGGSSSDGTTSDGTSSDTTSSSVLTALEQALQSSGSTSATGGTASDLSAASVGTATSASDPRIQSMVQEANSLLGKPYLWGGGHNDFGPQSGYDCSGFVSAVLHAGGYLTSPQDTETLPSAAGIESGPGQYVTIYDRTTPGQEGHVIMSIDGQFYESGGESSTWGGGGGVEKISTPSASYLSTFNQILHPEGL